MRSSKKGPYVDPKLLIKIARQKEAGKKEPLKPGLAPVKLRRNLWVTLFRSITVKNLLTSLSMKPWLATA